MPDELRNLDHVDLSNADVKFLDLSGSRVRSLNLNGTRLTDAWMPDTEIEGMYAGLTVNDIPVAPHVFAEIRRMHPLLNELSPTTVDGMRRGFELVYGLWDDLVTRASSLDEAVLHQRVNDEWSFVETLRHLVYATDCWFLRVVLDDAHPFHRLALQHSEAESLDPGIDVDAQPTFDEVLVARRDRQARVRDYLAKIDDAELDRVCDPTTPGHPEGTHKAGDALHVVLDEEYWHSTYATRDLDIVTRSP